MAELLVQIDGQNVPLKDCSWLQTAPCGCVTAVTMAATRAKTLATAEQAHKHLCPQKRERDKDERDGLTLRLITNAYYHAEISTSWECKQHQKVAAS